MEAISINFPYLMTRRSLMSKKLTRRCLKCEKSFRARNKHNHICSLCKCGSDYINGPSFNEVFHECFGLITHIKGNKVYLSVD